MKKIIVLIVIFLVMALSVAVGFKYYSIYRVKAAAAAYKEDEAKEEVLSMAALKNYAKAKGMKAVESEYGVWRLKTEDLNYIGDFTPCQRWIGADGQHYMISAFTASVDPEDEPSGGTPGTGRLLLFVRQGDQYVLKTEQEVEGGRHGTSPTISLVRLGGKEWGWQNVGGISLQGVNFDFVELLHAATPASIHSMATFTVHYDDIASGHCDPEMKPEDDDSPPCTSTEFSAKWHLEPIAGMQFYRLDIQWADTNKVEINGKIQIFPEKNGQYAIPKILKSPFQ